MSKITQQEKFNIASKFPLKWKIKRKKDDLHCRQVALFDWLLDRGSAGVPARSITLNAGGDARAPTLFATTN